MRWCTTAIGRSRRPCCWRMPAFLCPARRFFCWPAFWLIPNTNCSSSGSSWWQRLPPLWVTISDLSLGYYGGRPLLRTLPIVLSNSSRDAGAGRADLFARYGAVTIFFARFVFRHADHRRTHGRSSAHVVEEISASSTFLAPRLWVSVISGAGYLFGRHWQRLERIIKRFDIAVAVAVVLIAGWYWWRSRRRSHP